MAGCVVASAVQTPGMPDFSGLQRRSDRFGFRSEFRPLRPSSIPSKRIREVSTFDIAGDAGRGYVRLSSLTEAAPARKFKYPQGPQVPLHFSDRSRKMRCESVWY